MKKLLRIKSVLRGETLIEVIIAVSVLILVIAPAAAVQISSMRSTAVNRSELIASALAEEGIEMARNIRDSNLLRFSSKASLCWNTRPQYQAIDGCENDANKIGNSALPVGGTGGLPYRLEFNPAPDADARWKLAAEPLGTPLRSFPDSSGSSTDEFYRLKLDEDSIRPAHKHFIDDTHMYRHECSPSVPCRPTDFYREIIIQYLDLIPAGAGPEAMRVTSRVRYRVGGSFYEDARFAILTSRPS